MSIRRIGTVLLLPFWFESSRRILEHNLNSIVILVLKYRYCLLLIFLGWRWCNEVLGSLSCVILGLFRRGANSHSPDVGSSF